MENKKIQQTNKSREKRIYDEIIVDCYDEIEQMMGWWYYLDNTLKFPFTAKCIKTKNISPLKIGETVKAIGMGALEDCESDMFVIIEWCGRKLGVPFAQLEPAKSHTQAGQVAEDWRYWSRH
ncbi:MAG: hypothetical protein ACD_7C00492G0007 [uncultured bacterium]|nr:MAG: hypothetical protein ACD_7C00492G0007 [uncultured bacterium]HBR79340.1 calcium-binding protein [Candidatus Moranbacteria bacterium]